MEVRERERGTNSDDSIAQLVFQIIHYPKVWLGDFRTWTTAGTIVSLLVIFAIQWLEHMAVDKRRLIDITSRKLA